MRQQSLFQPDPPPLFARMDAIADEAERLAKHVRGEPTALQLRLAAALADELDDLLSEIASAVLP